MYMGVHVMLTGLRGFVAPFVGTLLYLLPSIGKGVFLFSMALSAIAVWGFWRMAKRPRDRVEEQSSRGTTKKAAAAAPERL
jgi:membrane protein implicated in regulation of membrane protease activity